MSETVVTEEVSAAGENRDCAKKEEKDSIRLMRAGLSDAEELHEMQAVLFGLMHNALFLLAGLDVGLWYHTLMFLFTGAGALLLGWLNEKIYNGSIIPGILFHGAGNFISSMQIGRASCRERV